MHHIRLQILPHEVFNHPREILQRTKYLKWNILGATMRMYGLINLGVHAFVRGKYTIDTIYHRVIWEAFLHELKKKGS